MLARYYLHLVLNLIMFDT